jgi:CubicO group peptidase (beta-lactamase class C family)
MRDSRPRMANSAAVLATAVLLLAGAGTASAAESPAPTGAALPGLGAFDDAMQTLLRRWDVPGGSLAVAYEGRLVLARGYGYADTQRRVRVEPVSLFRLASLSKTVTAVAVLQLVQAGRLGLDDPILPMLGEAGPRPDKIRDRRVRDITVRHLLLHTAGFDREKSGDPVFPPRAVAAARRHKAPLPPDCPTVMRDALEQPLDFAPGARHAYGNIAYCILGRVVERAAGMPYEAYVRERLLMPSGATRMQVGRTLTHAEGEVRYYDWETKEYPAVPGLGIKSGPRPYGEFAVETMDSYGGWIGAPADYLRFLLAIDGRRGPTLLDAAMLEQMHAAPGLGVNVRPVRGGVNLWHSGSLPGTSTMAVRTADGASWVVAFNRRPRERSAFRGEMDRALQSARGHVQNWPSGDLFGSLP